jgi:hypothetical protein
MVTAIAFVVCTVGVMHWQNATAPHGRLRAGAARTEFTPNPAT